MEKLKLKHLAPYSPYELKMAFIVREEIIKVGTLNNISIDNSDTHPIRYSIDTLNELEHEWMFKPILRPLSDLTNTIIIKNKEVIPYLWWDDEERRQDLYLCSKDYEYVEYLEYFIVELLLEWHFDVFGLIPQGLAIDINTL